MTRIADLLAAGPTLSFEFFPPKTDDAAKALVGVVAELAELRPSFVSVTYGAGGSTRERTRDVVVRINDDHPFPAMPHLTCVGHTRADITALLSRALADARERGCQTSTLVATPSGRPGYERVGYRGLGALQLSLRRRRPKNRHTNIVSP